MGKHVWLLGFLLISCVHAPVVQEVLSVGYIVLQDGTSVSLR